MRYQQKAKPADLFSVTTAQPDAWKDAALSANSPRCAISRRPSAQPGALGLGGNGGKGIGTEAVGEDSGGGGGGGYYGGGGGAGEQDTEESNDPQPDDTDDGAGGGGGSGYGPAGVTFETGVHAGNGLVILAWVVERGCGEQPSAEVTEAVPAAPRFTG